MAKRKTKQKSSRRSPSRLPSPPSPSPPPEESPLTKPTKTLFCLSLLLFSISLLSFAGTFFVHRTNWNSSGVGRSKSSRVTATCACKCFNETGGTETNDDNDDIMHKELLIGYKILHHTLYKESQLKYLHWLRGVTFRGPKGSLKTIMTDIYETSQKRVHELDRRLFKEQPAIRIREAPVSAIGDSIQNDVEASSTAELVPLRSLFTSSKSSSALSLSEWGIRFLLIQAQATRMVVGLSTSLRKLEQNTARKEWLTKLAAEYEAIREDLVECLAFHLGGGGGKATEGTDHRSSIESV